MQTLNKMKYALLILAGFFTLSVYSSCKKEYTCRCIHIVKSTDTLTNVLEHTSQKQAERQCKSGNGQISSYYNCELIGSGVSTKKATTK